MEEARELLLKHLYLQGGDGLGISDGKVYNACLDAIMEALTIPVVVGQSEQLKPMVFALANKLAIAGEGDAAVGMHRIHNRL